MTPMKTVVPQVGCLVARRHDGHYRVIPTVRPIRTHSRWMSLALMVGMTGSWGVVVGCWALVHSFF